VYQNIAQYGENGIAACVSMAAALGEEKQWPLAKMWRRRRRRRAAAARKYAAKKKKRLKMARLAANRK